MFLAGTRVTAFRRSIIPQKQFIIIINQNEIKLTNRNYKFIPRLYLESSEGLCVALFVYSLSVLGHKLKIILLIQIL